MLIHQSQILVECFSRKSDSLWLPQIYREGDSLELIGIDFTCPINFLYENIEQLT